MQKLVKIADALQKSTAEIRNTISTMLGNIVYRTRNILIFSKFIKLEEADQG